WLADIPGHAPGRGFVVYPADDGEPVHLEYPDGATALTCDHARLVAALREAETITVGTIVGADGRSAVSRKWLRLRDDRVPVSCTAGLLLEDAELPHE